MSILRVSQGRAMVLVCTLGLWGCQKSPEPEAGPKLDTDVARASYGLGYNVAGNVRNQYGSAIDVAAFEAGIEDRFGDADMRVSEEQVLAGLNALNEARETARATEADANKTASETFLAENGKRAGVVTLPSGLQYEILTEGTGPKPGPDDEVVTHYHGTLADGTVFDSSVDRGEPVTFPVRGVIRGWVEALQLMPVGSKWKLYLPPDLAYGDRGAGGKIGPNQALVFEVELLEIVAPKEAAQP